MIAGTVTPDASEARIQVTVRGPDGRELNATAVIDTGFTGALTLSRTSIQRLALPYLHELVATLADGATFVTATYEAQVVWDGHLRAITVMAANGDPLVGMALLHGYHLGLDVVSGGVITITALTAA
ncbi:MAG: clan AA aspartic protease [Chloroflexota bacterium]